MSERASDGFHPLLRHHLVNTLGWRDLRPLQELAAGPILSGEHALVLAPTAGGKTEAAILPAISRLLAENWHGTSILYLCPLKALLNNLHERLETYFRMVGHQVGLWHGDVPAGARRRIENERPACLMTTPESLEVMLISRREEPKRLLDGVRMVIVDEIHAFAGDDRGTHLLSVVERLSRMIGREVQRVGLSATVGNPDDLLDWLAGHCEGDRQVIAVPAPPAEAEVALDYVGTLENAALVISRLHHGEKRLVFCDSRRRVEELAVHLRGLGVETFVSHSSLSAEQRREAEEAFQRGQNCVIVATSTLELGIDVGDLDRVIQIDAPGSVASFLQRLGRTGRRPGTTRNCLFLATAPEALLHGAALISLWEAGYVEPIEAPRDPFHLFAQQVLALTLQHRALPRDGWVRDLGRLPSYARLGAERLEQVLRNLEARGFLAFDGVYFTIGDETEEQFGRRHFMDLSSVFTSSPDFEVIHGTRSIGTLDWLSLAWQDGRRRHPVILAGRSWDIEEIDWNRRKIYVKPSAEHGKVRWKGVGRGLSFELAREIHRLIQSDGVSPRWLRRATTEIAAQREALRDIAALLGRIVHDAGEDRVHWFTFAGAPLNELLGVYLRSRTGAEVSWDDFRVSLPGTADIPAIRDHIRRLLAAPDLAAEIPPSEELVENLKFAECLPADLAHRAALGRVGIDELGAKNLLSASNPRFEE